MAKLKFNSKGIGIEQYQDKLARIYRGTMNKPNDTMLTKVITFQVTEDCSLCCTYCYQKNKSHDKMSFETGKKFVDLLFKMYEENHPYINNENCNAIIIEFIGGEPLLEIDLIDFITEYFKYKAISENHPWAINHMFTLITNGVRYFDKKVQDYLKRNRDRCSFTISVDGNKELHDSCRVFPNGEGSYEYVERAIKYHNKNYGRISTKMTIAPQNVTYIYDAMLNLFNNLGYNNIFANCVYEEGWEPKHATIFYEQFKKVADYIIDNGLFYTHNITIFNADICRPMLEEDNNNWCGGTGKMLACSPDGELYPCLRYMKSSLGNDIPPIIIGNLDEGLAISDKYKNIVDNLNQITRRSQSTDECFNCPIAHGCSWCSAYNYQIFGTVNKRATFICIMHKARALVNVYYWNKLYKKIGEDERFKMNIPREWALEIIDEDEYNMLLELSK